MPDYSTVIARGTATTTFALLGQSNAVGYANIGDNATKTVEGTLWRNGVQRTAYGFSSEVSVETILAPSRTCIKRAYNGSSIQEWLDTYLDEAFADAVTAGVTPSVTIWIQGEADSKTLEDAEAYGGRLETMLDRIIAEWGPQRFIMPLLSTLGPARQHYPQLNAGVATLRDSRSDLFTHATDDIPKHTDNLHYSRKGQDMLARIFRAQMVGWGL